MFVQYAASAVINIFSFITGVFIGFPAPNGKLLSSDATPLTYGPMSSIEISWMNSLPSIGAIVSIPFFGLFIERVGRRGSLILIGIPQTVIFVFFSKVEALHNKVYSSWRLYLC